MTFSQEITLLIIGGLIGFILATAGAIWQYRFQLRLYKQQFEDQQELLERQLESQRVLYEQQLTDERERREGDRLREELLRPDNVDELNRRLLAIRTKGRALGLLKMDEFSVVMEETTRYARDMDGLTAQALQSGIRARRGINDLEALLSSAESEISEER